ncbi:MAG TPA: DNA (cytosine-5-)-methyltransferase [Actinomycetes bacterium]|nr:DNA (cytosine-5-)-methyltransferase [Actinomycetes bacterium]
MPTFGSLFAGIGGIDLGLERAGWTPRWSVEWDPYCQHVLAHHWPDVPRHGDIRTVHCAAACPHGDAEHLGREVAQGHQAAPAIGTGCRSCLEPVDLIAGGFPCQPWSMAGKRQGTEDDRWLWPEFERTIRELRPRYVLVENVPGLLAGRGGMGAVLGGLAALGYDAEWDCIPASAVGAPHRRDRVWIVAHTDAGRRDGRSGEQRPGRRGRPGDGGSSDVAHPLGKRGRGGHDGREHAADADAPGQGVGPGGDGEWWAVEPDVGRVAHGVPARLHGVDL